MSEFGGVNLGFPASNWEITRASVEAEFGAVACDAEMGCLRRGWSRSARRESGRFVLVGRLVKDNLSVVPKRRKSVKVRLAVGWIFPYPLRFEPK
jgi:hypothetical protein